MCISNNNDLGEEIHLQDPKKKKKKEKEKEKEKRNSIYKCLPSCRISPWPLPQIK